MEVRMKTRILFLIGLVSLFAILLNLILPQKSASHQGIEEGQDV